MAHSRVGGTAGMGVTGVQVNGLLERAAEAVESLSSEPVADEIDGGLHAPVGSRCVACGAVLGPRESVRRGRAGLQHETCPGPP